MLNLRAGLLNLNPKLQAEGEALQAKLQQINPVDLQKELNAQIAEKFNSFIKTIPILCNDLNEYIRPATTAPIIWQEGSTCLYQYKGREEGKRDEGIKKENSLPYSLTLLLPSCPILIIPSLINRHYILDLEESNSFVKYLAGNGMDIYLAAWNEPLQEELSFSMDDYISRVEKMIDEIYEKTQKKVVLTGYCMGGLLSLAAALGKSDKLSAIAFLATPWDFHTGNFPRFIFDKGNLQIAELSLENYSKIPASFLQAIFYYMYPNLIGHKFEMYPLLNSGHYSKEEFLAIEHWVNDGISMTKNVAKTCFIDWVHNNNVAKLTWKVQGRLVNPAELADLPAFFAIPKKDNIVPYPCALPLTKYFTNSKVIEPNSGHVGMLAGTSAKAQTWEPFLKWVENL